MDCALDCVALIHATQLDSRDCTWTVPQSPRLGPVLCYQDCAWTDWLHRLTTQKSLILWCNTSVYSFVFDFHEELSYSD